MQTSSIPKVAGIGSPAFLFPAGADENRMSTGRKLHIKTEMRTLKIVAAAGDEEVDFGDEDVDLEEFAEGEGGEADDDWGLEGEPGEDEEPV